MAWKKLKLNPLIIEELGANFKKMTTWRSFLEFRRVVPPTKYLFKKITDSKEQIKKRFRRGYFTENLSNFLKTP